MATTKEVLDVALKELGVKESPANSNNVKYNTWFYDESVSGSAYPWCMAFVRPDLFGQRYRLLLILLPVVPLCSSHL